MIIQIAGTAAANRRPRVTCAATFTSAARAELPTKTRALADKMQARDCPTTPSTIAKVGTMAIETSRRIKAIDNGCSFVHGTTRTIHDRGSLATREVGPMDH